MSQEIVGHVVRHHPGIAILSATINGTTVYFAAEGGEPVHTFLSQVAQGDCSKNLLLAFDSDPGVVNATWNGFVNATSEIGMNVKYAFSTLTDPACLASMTVKCFVAFNAVAPCIVKAVLQTGVDATKAAASSQAAAAGAGGAVAGLIAGAALVLGIGFWHRRNNAENTRLLEQRSESQVNHGL